MRNRSKIFFPRALSLSPLTRRPFHRIHCITTRDDTNDSLSRNNWHVETFFASGMQHILTKCSLFLEKKKIYWTFLRRRHSVDFASRRNFIWPVDLTWFDSKLTRFFSLFKLDPSGSLFLQLRALSAVSKASNTNAPRERMDFEKKKREESVSKRKERRWGEGRVARLARSASKYKKKKKRRKKWKSRFLSPRISGTDRWRRWKGSGKSRENRPKSPSRISLLLENRWATFATSVFTLVVDYKRLSPEERKREREREAIRGRDSSPPHARSQFSDPGSLFLVAHGSPSTSNRFEKRSLLITITTATMRKLEDHFPMEGK